ncbi:tRNA (adenosine(37)-N6)-threonylcarbamoyltransferase complex dimerization subunit type 1 TsaB [Allomuricauda sp. SCSIO 65647]|uniref:tRNA (adenosine(37)-N6)-threonylcarbamoyltransferase complex dimerization subunit type 1 TsaB n=1 Tax=Allomuricauda sp. SCSIO 65647 TaxID=2908843 RepID=UPI001F2F9759|nr:tRNA (adenosine(37)-N6)-threonylcarbamoyltransferase complex dimerization subunit type 1 TsaB [Muricauda sp. SCSIO 65647]UJH68333.1 tRNA (adenosine(37)-N6)-threonylcarbamoyltransferase complex dimerization subunit type 1 TsaB [Muricauda sp. SCSIO 65647]
MAKILNLETATTNCSVSIADKGDLVCLKEENSANYSHSEQLHVFIEQALQEASMAFSDLDAIAVSKGPGSYTGLRIGVSAAKGLCFSLDVPLISVPTLESMASQLDVSEDEVIVAMLDARRMEVYSAVYDHHGEEIRETRAEVIDAASFMEFSKRPKIHLIGSGAEKCREILPKDRNFIFHTGAFPSSKEMAVLSHKKFETGQFEDVAYFEPYYLKDFILQKKKT